MNLRVTFWGAAHTVTGSMLSSKSGIAKTCRRNKEFPFAPPITIAANQ